MRKILSFLLVSLLCCGLLTGCAGKDVTTLPHNKKISISDKQDEVVEADNLVPEGVLNYTRENVEIDGNEYQVHYQFNNDGEITGVIYDSDEATLDEAQKYVDSIYGELDIDTTKGKYGPGREKNYIIKSDDKTWVIGCFVTDNKKTRIIISRDTTLD